MRTICISNQKGGVGKSTTATATAGGLFRRGKKVLIVDLDPQMNSSYMSGIDLLNLPATLYDVFTGQAEITQAVQPIQIGIDIVTGGLNLTSADMTFVDLGREKLLQQALDGIRGNYDYCIIDTSPNLGVLATNAMTAADSVLVPMQCDALSLQGLLQLQDFITKIKMYCNPKLSVAGILLTMYNPRTVLSRSLEEAVQMAAANMGTKIYKTRIRRAQAVSDAIAVQSDIFTEAPTATATADYTAFVDELLNDMEGEDNGDEE